MHENEFQLITYKDNDFLIDIKVSLDEEIDNLLGNKIINVSVRQESCQTAYYFASTFVKNNKYISESKIDASTIRFYQMVQEENGKNIQRNIKIYNLENIYLFTNKVISKIISKYISSINKIINQIKGVNLYYE